MSGSVPAVDTSSQQFYTARDVPEKAGPILTISVCFSGGSPELDFIESS
jgi:hypothetical protein